jgi:hypothetical protein
MNEKILGYGFATIVLLFILFVFILPMLGIKLF